MSKKKRPKRSRSHRSARPGRGAGTLVTPEGDVLTFTSAYYRHAALAEIRHILTEADNFGLDDDLEAGPDGAWRFPWYETDSDQPALFVPMGDVFWLT